MPKHTKNRRVTFMCGICEEPYTFESDLLVHLVQDHLVHHDHFTHFRYVCPSCKKSFPDSGTLDAHMAMMHPRRGSSAAPEIPAAFRCNLCPLSFRTLNQLTIHRRAHSKSPALKCKVCERTFKAKAKMDAHVCSHRPYPCDTCGRKFETLAEAEAHCAPPFMEKPFRCRTCGKCFRLYQQHWSHCKKHDEERCSNERAVERAKQESKMMFLSNNKNRT